mmetsp:Transcript_30538/g.57215  ORF Transcript_30538/g.57215 Transcript_30538/m.57215 type:complete len:316 (-) Transcript_30538:54-1001(-)
MAHAAYKDIVMTLNLWTGNDDLYRFRIVRIWDGVVQKTNATNNLSRGADLVLRKVGRVSNNHGCFGHHFGALVFKGCGLDPTRFSTLVVDNFIDVLVQHEGTTMNGTNSGESFGQTSQSVDRIDVGGSSVSTEGITIGLELRDGWQGRQVHVFFVELQTHGVTDELMSVGLQPKVGVELTHGHFGEVSSLMGFRFLGVVLVNVQEEVAEAAFLKQSHERRRERLFGRGRDLQNLASLVHVGSSNALEVKIPSNLGVEEHFGEVSGRHDKLGNQIDIVITVLSQIRRGLSSLELLKEIREVKGGSVATVVSVAVQL